MEEEGPEAGGTIRPTGTRYNAKKVHAGGSPTSPWPGFNYINRRIGEPSFSQYSMGQFTLDPTHRGSRGSRWGSSFGSISGPRVRLLVVGFPHFRVAFSGPLGWLLGASSGQQVGK
jgi:hypothetical protein